MLEPKYTSSMAEEIERVFGSETPPKTPQSPPQRDLLPKPVQENIAWEEFRSFKL